VLGLRLPESLSALGFRWRPSFSGIIWQRQLPDGSTETYSSREIEELETQRRQLVDRVADLGLTIEANPSSNLRLSGLEPLSYPMGRLLADRPDLRMSVSTDNPAFHATDPATELALLAVSADAPFSRVAMLFLEGYASRLGRRSLGDVAALRTSVTEALVSRTPAGERADVLRLLDARFNLGLGYLDASMTPEQFRAELKPYMDMVFQ